MPAPMGKHVQVEGGRRPWNVPQEPYKRERETPREAAMREACLECGLPDCMPNASTCAANAIDPQRAGRRLVRPLPEDFLAMSKRMTISELAKHYGVTVSVVGRWRVESGLRAFIARERPPENFLYYGRIESAEKLAERYGVSRSTVSKWRYELGIKPGTKK